MDDLAKNREVRYPHEILKIDAEVNGGKETMHTWGGLTVCRMANAHSDVRADHEKSAEAIVPSRTSLMEVLGRAER